MGKAVIDPGDAIGGFSLPEKPRLRSRRWGCLITGLVLFVLFLVIDAGVGRPFTYWHRISEVQIFEGPDRIVLFVEVDRFKRRPGLLASPRSVHMPIQLLRIDVFPDGRLKRMVLQHDGYIFFSTNIAPIVRGKDDFYLIERPSLGQPDIRLHRIHGDRIETLSKDESRTIVEEAGIAKHGRKLRDYLDGISQLYGWHRLNDTSYSFMQPREGFASARHNLRVRGTYSGPSQMIRAESLSDDGPWVKPVEVVSLHQWKSYRDLLP